MSPTWILLFAVVNLGGFFGSDAQPVISSVQTFYEVTDCQEAGRRLEADMSQKGVLAVKTSCVKLRPNPNQKPHAHPK